LVLGIEAIAMGRQDRARRVELQESFRGRRRRLSTPKVSGVTPHGAGAQIKK
jgi:hypothetical protein